MSPARHAGGTFHEIAKAPPEPTPPPGEHDLHPPLPDPPVLWLGGYPYDLRYVEIGQLEAWKRERGLETARVTWCGRLGFVSVMKRREAEQ